MAKVQENGKGKEKVWVFDTTLRDGEQSPGATMTLDEKVQIATLLDEMGVDVIEAGFPAASEGDFEAVSAVSAVVKRATVCGLSRAGAGDVDRAGEALKGAVHPRIHTFLSTSPVHRKHKLGMDKGQVLEAVEFSVKRARNWTDDVQWSPEDATRTEPDFLKECVETAIRSGATTINIPDTVGYSTPGEFEELIRMLKEGAEGAEGVRFSTHCHNDLGLAVANSLAGLRGGARQVECTINGLGERAGNASLEEVVMAMRVRGDALPYETGVESEKLLRASKMVSGATGFPVQYNKAIVGRNAFAHEAGIHQDGMLKNSNTYEIMTPDSVGFAKTSLVMGKHSGRHAFSEKLKEMGYEVGDNAMKAAFVKFKALADKKKDVYDDDIAALLDDHAARSQEAIQVKDLKVEAGMGSGGKASVMLSCSGEDRRGEGRGDGPVDAIFKAIGEAYEHDAKLSLYQVTAVTGGTDAQAEVTVRLSEGDKTASARASDTDTMLASARAYVGALNRLSRAGGVREGI